MGALAGRVSPRRASLQAERLALFVCALHREEADELLEGLATTARRRARAFAAEVLSWDTARRQALLLLELGPRDQPGERLRALLAEAPPALRRALTAAVPLALRPELPEVTGSGPVPRGLARLAARLVREALG